MDLNTLQLRTDHDGRWLRFEGDVNYATIDEVRETLREGLRKASAPIVFDMRGVTFLGSMGVELLLECAKEDARQRLVLLLNEEIDRVLNAAGVKGKFRVAATAGDAERMVGEEAT
ncbi:MAG: STAS domain-containing protein [Planctomycetota bacterium]|nr:STAS domain-containing protein [Planctomycetota bacterium]